MKFYINESGSAGREFNTLQEFLDAISELAGTYEENEEEWFEIQVIND